MPQNQAVQSLECQFQHGFNGLAILIGTSFAGTEFLSLVSGSSSHLQSLFGIAHLLGLGPLRPFNLPPYSSTEDDPSSRPPWRLLALGTFTTSAGSSPLIAFVSHVRIGGTSKPKAYYLWMMYYLRASR